MSADKFFPPRPNSKPTIYAYEDANPQYIGLLKIGYRERCLKDVITQLEPGLFRKVSGLTVKEFELLVSLGVFNSALVNDAVFKFKRDEDSSLSYTGINKHEREDIGLYDTVISTKDYHAIFENMSEKV